MVVRSSFEPVGGIWIGVIKTGAAVTDDTFCINDPTYGHPGANRIWWATINGTASHTAINCDLGGTSKVTVGIGNVTDGEMLVIATAE